MTPEEKGDEIYFAMLNAGRGMVSGFLARQCAMICVQEILQLQENESYEGEAQFVTGNDQVYWQSVLTHLKA